MNEHKPDSSGGVFSPVIDGRVWRQNIVVSRGSGGSHDYQPRESYRSPSSVELAFKQKGYDFL